MRCFSSITKYNKVLNIFSKNNLGHKGLTLKIVYVDVILLLQGRSKEILYMTVHGRYLLEANFSNANIP